jgi:hypothetical protein
MDDQYTGYRIVFDGLDWVEKGMCEGRMVEKGRTQIMIHKIKIMPEYFKAVLEGRKPFEIRNNDRHYQEGDIAVLQEWDG